MAKPKRGRPPVERFWSLLQAGESPEDIQAAMDLDEEQYDALRAKVVEAKAAELRGRPPEQVFVEYFAGQASVLADLAKTIDAIKRDMTEPGSAPKCAAPMVQALRLKSDILGELVKTGQALGVTSKAADRLQVIGGLSIASLGRDDLKRLFAEESEKMAVLLAGAVPFAKVAVGELHYGPTGNPDAIVDVPDEPD